MSPRRLLLCAGFTVFVFSATHRVSASDPWEVEGGGYGGGGTGHIACGPDERVAYGGLGAEVRYSGARTGEGLGVAFDVGGVVEAQRQWPVDCLTTACQQDFVSGVVPTGRARVGLDSPYFGLRGGVLAFAEPQYAQGLHYYPLPDVALRLGRLDGFRAVVGFGAYDLVTYLRPGAYLGFLAAVGRGWDLGLHGGIGYVTHGTIGLRETATVRAPLTEHLWLRSDFGVTQSQDVGTDFVLSVGWGM
jgi:hypothetical protein